MTENWAKSTKSAQGDCLEARRWTKSSRSGNNGQCVEAMDTGTTAVLLRDTKDRDGGTLAFDRAAWTGFIGLVKSGSLSS